MSTEAVPMELEISKMEVSEISEQDLETTFQRVVVAHKDAIRSIQQSMKDVDDVFGKYLNPDYIPIEDIAKKDRAVLNRSEKNIAEQYALLKEAYEKPLANIDANIRQIRAAIKNAACTVDSAVKNYELVQKTAKREEIQAYFNSKKFELVPLEKIFNEKWLNKTKPMKEVREELDAVIDAIYQNVEILEKISEHGMMAKAFYLEKLDFGAALRQVDTLKENAARIAREQASREARKAQEQCEQNDKAERQEKCAWHKEERVQSVIDEALDLPEGTTAAQAREEIIEYTCTFKGTREQLLQLRQYMTKIGMPYQKGLLLDNPDDARIVAKEKNVAGKIYSFIYVPNVA